MFTSAMPSLTLQYEVATLSEQCALGCLKTLVLLTSDSPQQSSQEETKSPVNQLSALVVQNPLAFHVIARFVVQGGDPSTHSLEFEHACLGLALLLNLVKEGSTGAKQVKGLSKCSNKLEHSSHSDCC
jgi:hypothetical protein